MNCQQVEEQEVIERYLAEKLSEQESAAFEEHFLGCKQCFEELRLHHAAAAEMRLRPLRTRQMPLTKWNQAWLKGLAVAAVLVLAFVSVMFLRRGHSPEPQQSSVVPPDLHEELFKELAAINVPPLYVPSTIRGSKSDRALEKFRHGMENYQKGNYLEAVGVLQEASELDPSHMPSRFYLGISLLMANQTDEAIGQLSKLVEPGSNPYSEEVHWYLAKAYFKKREVSPARKELEAVVARNGPHAEEAKKELEKLGNMAEPGQLPSPSP